MSNLSALDDAVSGSAALGAPAAASRRTLRRRGAAVLLTAGLLIGSAACGSDDTASSATTSASDPGDESAAGGTDLDAYCEASIAVDQTFQAIDPSDTAAFAAALEDAAPIVDDLVAAAPEELHEQATVMMAAFNEVKESGDFSAFETEEVGAAEAATHAFDLEHCDLARVDVTATDYHFAGDLPTEAGRVSVEMTNEGAEPHLMIIARKKDGVEGSAMEAFEAIEGEEDFPNSFDQTVTVFAEPGGSEYGLGELSPGEYVAFCPVPVGSGAEGEGEGPPHFVQGMVETFTVA